MRAKRNAMEYQSCFRKKANKDAMIQSGDVSTKYSRSWWQYRIRIASIFAGLFWNRHFYCRIYRSHVGTVANSLNSFDVAFSHAHWKLNEILNWNICKFFNCATRLAVTSQTIGSYKNVFISSSSGLFHFYFCECKNPTFVFYLNGFIFIMIYSVDGASVIA